MLAIEHHRFDDPDESLPYPGAAFDLVNVAAGGLWRYTFDPGWRYSVDVPPEDGTVLCPEPHLMYHVSGRLGFRTQGGEEFEAGPGDVTSMPANHDAWVIGEEPAVAVDFFGVTHAATEGEPTT